MNNYLYRSGKLLLIIIFLLFLTNNITVANSLEVYKVNWDNLRETSFSIINKDENNILANFQYSIALANLGRIEEAYEHFELISDKVTVEEFNNVLSPYISKLQNRPNDILLLNYAAFSSSINSEYQNSVLHFKKILSLDSDNIWIRNFLAATYLELKEYDNAKSEANRALDIKDNKYSHLLLGIVYYQTGNIVKAIIEIGRSGDLVNKIIFK
ncbi:MAG: tetratricopeptide repeat protein [bacterium]